MGLGATSVCKFLREVNGPVEAQAAVVEDVNVQGLEVSRGVDNPNRACLDEVIGNLFSCQLIAAVLWSTHSRLPQGAFDPA